MTDLFFVDTNVLVYQHDAARGEKHTRALEWALWAWDTNRGRVSYQVLREFYSVVTTKLVPGMDRSVAQRYTRALLDWSPIHDSQDTFEAAWALQQRYRLSWWDALIVAAAQRQNCRYLLSEDLQHGQVLDSVEVVNPFNVSPAEVT